MRYTAKITLIIGFTVSSAVTIILERTGTGFKAMTSVLYLYGFTCLAGGLIGYRHAYLEHGEGIKNPGIHHITGIEKLKQVFRKDLWKVETEDCEFKAENIRIHGKLVSLRQEDGTEISYPRKSVEKIEKLSP